jgi:hypothetical protein
MLSLSQVSLTSHFMLILVMSVKRAKVDSITSCYFFFFLKWQEYMPAQVNMFLYLN